MVIIWSAITYRRRPVPLLGLDPTTRNERTAAQHLWGTRFPWIWLPEARKGATSIFSRSANSSRALRPARQYGQTISRPRTPPLARPGHYCRSSRSPRTGLSARLLRRTRFLGGSQGWRFSLQRLPRRTDGLGGVIRSGSFSSRPPDFQRALYGRTRFLWRISSSVTPEAPMAVAPSGVHTERSWKWGRPPVNYKNKVGGRTYGVLLFIQFLRILCFHTSLPWTDNLL